MNGCSSGYVTPSIVTCDSCMHSRSAACVLGDARFTSSTSSRLANTGPGLNSNRLERWSKTFTPVTSDGRRSGVNWRREKEQSSERARAFASIVFPTPGKSSMIKCPSATRQSTVMRSVSSDACTTRRRFAAIASTRSAGAGAIARSAKQALHLVENLRRYLAFGGLRKLAIATRCDKGHLVVARLEADVAPTHVVEDEQISVLVRQLPTGALEPGLAQIGREADEYLARHALPAERREHVGRRLERDRPSAPIFRPLRRERLRRPVVGNGGRHDHEVGLRGARERLALELGAGGRLHELDSGGRRHGEIRPEERHMRPARSGLGRERDAHPPRRAVADVPDCVDRLAGAAGRDEHALPTKGARAGKELLRRTNDVLRLRHAADAELALCSLTFVGSHEHDAAKTKRLRVGTGGGMRPHTWIHRGRDDHRPAMSEGRLGEDV